MRIVILATLACALASPGLAAASLPLKGDYGTASGCQSLPPFTVETGTSVLRLSRHEVNGLEWKCSFNRVAKTLMGYSIAAACSSEGSTHADAISLWQAPAGVVIYSGPSGVFVLHRCK